MLIITLLTPRDQVNTQCLISNVSIPLDYLSFPLLVFSSDALKLHNHAEFMTLAGEYQTNYPIGRTTWIFHTNVIYKSTGSAQHSNKPERMEFVWIQWLGQDLGSFYHKGWHIWFH